MALINRMTRLFQTDMHAVLDRLEEPEQLLRQSVREMEEALSLERTQLNLLIHEQKRASIRQEQLAASFEKTEHEISTCLDTGNEDLARNFVRRKLETDQLRVSVNSQLAELAEQIGHARDQVSSHESHLESMRQKVNILSPDTSSTPGDERWLGSVSEDEVEVALIAEIQRRAS